jgi:hypothetical protein
MARTRSLILLLAALPAAVALGLLLFWSLGREQGWTAESRALPTRLTNLSGISWDGSRLWLTVDGSARLYRVHPETGAVERTFVLPAVDTGGSSWDGRRLWQLAYNDRRIYRIDPRDGRIELSIPSPGRGRCSGMAYDGRHLWLANWEDKLIYEIDQERGGRVLRSLQGDFETSGLAWDGRYLWNGVMVGAEEAHDASAPPTGFVQQRDVATGEILRVFPIPGVGPGASDWLPGEGRRSCRFWWYDHFHGKVVRLDLKEEGEGAVRSSLAGLLLLNAGTAVAAAVAFRPRGAARS